MKCEFEERIAGTVSQENYQIIEFVYNYYPKIGDKNAVAVLYKQFGMVIFKDLLPRAQKIAELEDKVNKLKTEMNRINEEMKQLCA